MAEPKATAKPIPEMKIQEEFNKLRNDQRKISTKLSEVEMEDNELRVVIRTLEEVKGDRKCYRLIGGVLVERTVETVLPCLKREMEKTQAEIVKLQEDMTKKGVEINEFKEKHNIIIRSVSSKP